MGRESIWLPAPLVDEARRMGVYKLSAKHRGDMYHIRAAMSIEPRPLYIYESEGGPDLVAYLTKLATKGYFTVPWDGYTTRTAKRERDDSIRAPSMAGCTCFDGQNIVDVRSKIGFESNIDILTEGRATWVIDTRIQSDIKGRSSEERLVALRKNMAIVQDPVQIKRAFDGILSTIFGTSDSKKPKVLVMWRGTGKANGGAYPELDTGDAIKDMVEAINELPPDKAGRKLTPLLCGNPATEHAEYASLGEYWKHPAYRALNLDYTKQSGRDVEAFFMKYAYERKYYELVIGCRSGALDSFTFMGIPTVSVGLKNMVGDIRHNKLAYSWWKRTNVSYEQPRHSLTAWIQNTRGDPPKPPLLLTSPYWGGAAPRDAIVRPAFRLYDGSVLAEKQRSLAEETRLRSDRTKGFTNFDRDIFDTGLALACIKELEWNSLPRFSQVEPKETRIVDNIVTRRLYPSDVEPGEPLNRWLDGRKALERSDWTARKERGAQLQESDAEYKARFYDVMDDIELVMTIANPPSNEDDEE